MTLAIRTRSARSAIGLKAVMAVTGGVLGLFVIAHLASNLEFFTGRAEFNSYAAWLRRLGEPVLGPTWFLWVQRSVLLACVVTHVAAAVTLTRRDRAARPVRYRHRTRGAVTTLTMRWGGAVVGLFIVYHVLDLSVGVAHPDFVAGDVYHNVVADFRHWYVTAAYTVATIAVGLHLRHGLWSGARSLGRQLPRAVTTGIAMVVTVGFLTVPLAVQTGLMR
jgi:succinate dehydrogenase / fumarate reductase, cytochrome b subunit